MPFTGKAQNHPLAFFPAWLPLCGMLCLGVSLAACKPHDPGSLHILLREPPLNLNPQKTLDATGQQMGALLFSSLTQLNADLQVEGDLATEWSHSKDMKKWTFLIPTGEGTRKDHSGAPIAAQQIAACLENYRLNNGGPAALQPFYENWKTSEAPSPQKLVLEFEKPQPYAPQNLSYLRYFLLEGHAEPCSTEETPGNLIGSGPYRMERWDPTPEGPFTLYPVAENAAPPLQFVFTQDENTKLLKILRGDIEAAYNTVPFSKTQWLRETKGHTYQFLDREGSRVSYLAFNLKHPLLSQSAVRKALALAIDREQIVRSRIPGAVADSILPRQLPEANPIPLAFDPQKAEALLDAAGYKKGPDQRRFSLRYKTTSARESLELAVIFQKMFERIGVELKIEAVEPAVFFASIRKGNYELYTSRWLGITDGTILYRTLHSSQTLSRTGYANPELDRLLEKAIHEPDAALRNQLFHQVQKLAAADIPFFPLWYWSNTLIIKKNITGIEPRDLSLAGALKPLTLLRFQSSLTRPSSNPTKEPTP